MFGLFKRKATLVEFEQSKIDGTVYPGDSITVLQIQTESGQFGTAWVNKKYKGYAFKEFCPYFIVMKMDLSNIDGEQRDQLDMSTIEDYFDAQLKTIGICHFIARFVTDKGMEMLFYSESNPKFEEVINELMKENDLNLDFEVNINENDPMWRSMKMVLG